MLVIFSLVIFSLLLTNCINVLTNKHYGLGVSVFSLLGYIYCVDLISKHGLDLSLIVYSTVLFVTVLSILCLYKNTKTFNKQLIRLLIRMIFVTVISVVFFYFAINYTPFTSLGLKANKTISIITSLVGSSSVNLSEPQLIIYSLIAKCMGVVSQDSLLHVIKCCIYGLEFIFIFLSVDLMVSLYTFVRRKSSYFIGYILAIGCLFTLTNLRFGYLIDLWLIFPISYVLLSGRNINEDNSKFIQFVSLFFILVSIFTLTFSLTTSLSIVALLVLDLIITNSFDFVFTKCRKLIEYRWIILLGITGLSFLIAFYKHLDFTAIYNRVYFQVIQGELFYFINDYSMQLAYAAIGCIGLVSIFINMGKVKLSCGITVILFILVNPLVLTVVNNYVSDARFLLMLIFNPVSCMYICEYITEIRLNNKEIVAVLVVLLSIDGSVAFNPYYVDSETYNKTYRIEQEEYELYEYMLTTYDFSKETKVISQVPYTKVFLPNVTLLNEYEYLSSLCQYCDVVTDDIHSPNDATNIFAYREQPGTNLFVESADYAQACSIATYNDFEYLILRKDQTSVINEQWSLLYELMSSCYNLDYETEHYVVMSIK